MAVQEAVQQEELRVPPYYERFQEEREKRFSSEIARLETEIRHNGQRIADLDKKIDAVRDELKGDIAELRNELKGDIAELRNELKGDIAELRNELKGDIAELRREMTSLRGEMTSLRADMHSQFRWMVGLLLPVTLGVVAIIVQNLLKP